MFIAGEFYHNWQFEMINLIFRNLTLGKIILCIDVTVKVKYACTLLLSLVSLFMSNILQSLYLGVDEEFSKYCHNPTNNLVEVVLLSVKQGLR